jgi:hypothetical protein
MAKKSLKKRIDDLVDALGGAEKPTLAQIRNDLVSIGTFAQELEDGQALAEKETAIAALEAELGNLKIELQSANAEIETFRAAREKQQEEERKKDIPPEQLDILRRLPSEYGGLGLTVPQIWREVNGRLDETEIHVNKLEIFIHPHLGIKEALTDFVPVSTGISLTEVSNSSETRLFKN